MIVTNGYSVDQNVQEALERADAAIGVDIHLVSGPRRTTAIERCRQDGSMLVVMYGVPMGTDTTTRDSNLGSGIGTIYDVMRPTTMPDNGFTLPDRDTVVGEYRPMEYYSYVGLTRMHAFSYEELDAVIVAPIIAASDPTNIAEFRERAALAARERLVTFARGAHQRGIAERRATLRDTEAQIVSYSDYITGFLRTAKQASDELEVLLTLQGNDDGSRMIEQFDALGEHPRLVSVAFSGEDIVMRTTPDITLHDYDRDDERWMGTFEIKINLAAQQVFLTNMDTPRGGRDHPHVTDGHRPCFGGHEMEFAQLMSQGELLTLVELLINYLETYNPEDTWGRYGSYWFDEEDQRPAELQTA